MDYLNPGKENKLSVLKQDICLTLTTSENIGESLSNDFLKPKQKPPTIDDFELLKPISRGAFGKVFLGRKKTDPETLYAVKVLKKADLINKNLILQVTAERDALAMVHSPFVVQLFYSLQSQQNIYLVMEYLVGGDVKSLLAVYGYLREDVSCMYAAEVSLALEHLHNRGIIHRDLKPDNMLISGKGHIKLTDFGLSKVTIEVVDPPLKINQLTPRTQLDQFRTPGQILSLRSSLSFSAPRSEEHPSSSDCKSKPRKSILSSISSQYNTMKSDSVMSPLVNGILLTPETHSSRILSLHQRLANHSMISPRSPLNSHKSFNQTPPPIKSLTPSLRDSLHWGGSASTTNECSGMSDLKLQRWSSTMYAGDLDKIHENVSLHSSSFTSADDVFSSTHHDLRNLSFTLHHTAGGAACEALNCFSHDKASPRQESLLDSTPHLHRTSESVWNSFAARNLRSFREGSCTESFSDDKLSTDSSLSACLASETNMPEKSSSNKNVKPWLETLKKSVSHVSPQKGPLNSRLESLEEVTREGASSDKEKTLNSVSSDSDDPREKSHGCNYQRHHNLKRSYTNLEINDLPGSLCSGLTQKVRLMYLNEYDHLTFKRKNCSSFSGYNLDDANQNSVIDCELSLVSQQLSTENSTCIPNKVRVMSSKTVGDKSSSTGLPQPLDPASPSKMTNKYLEDLNLQRSSCSESYGSLLVSSPERDSEEEYDDVGNFSMRSDNSYSRRTSLSAHTPNLQINQDNAVKENFGTKNNLKSDDSDESICGNGACDAEDELVSYNGVVASHCVLPALDAPFLKPLHMRKQMVEFMDQNPSKTSHFLKVQPFSADDVNFSCKGSELENSVKVAFTSSCFKTPDNPVGRVALNTAADIYWTPRSTKHLLNKPHCTPLRTPKLGVRRGPEPHPQEEERILGTPDYLAPEILLQEKHGAAVDWWALGVCLFEFLTGLPPFNDSTPEQVFSNILKRAISWPVDSDMMSLEAQEVINALLTMDPNKRPGAKEVKFMSFFSHLDWDNLLDTEPAFVPQPDNNMDTSYFEPKNNMQHLKISAVDL